MDCTKTILMMHVEIGMRQDGYDSDGAERGQTRRDGVRQVVDLTVRLESSVVCRIIIFQLISATARPT